jgi:hypothetical protein
MVERKPEQERREAERKAYEEKMTAKQKADQGKREAEWTVDREVVTRLEAIQSKTDANQMRVEPKTEHQQEKLDAWIADMENDQKETMACQDAMEVNLEKMGQNLREKEPIVERQEIPNKEVAIHSLRACQIKRMACQEAMKANPKKEPNEHAIAILEQMIACLLAGQEEMKAKADANRVQTLARMQEKMDANTKAM